jgi:uncharacterized protein
VTVDGEGTYLCDTTDFDPHRPLQSRMGRRTVGTESLPAPRRNCSVFERCAGGITLGCVDFFVYSRAAPSAASVEHGRELDEEHWAYMDRFADGMTARGPTLGADRETWTGSLHIVDLPSADAAREFVEHEPYNRAGLFEHHTIRRFRNLLGRTMWEFPRAPDEPRFLAIADRAAGEHAVPREQLIVHGELLTPDDARQAGVVFALQAATRDVVDELLGEHVDVEIHDWEFGGRR